jgi:hypothetical protein
VQVVSQPSILTILWGLSIVANACTAWRLRQLGLHSVYRFFFVYLIFATARSVALFLLPVSLVSSTYAIIYLVTAPALWIFYVLVVLELYSLVLRNYAGIYSLGRWTLYGALIFSIAISILTLIPSLGNEPSRLLFWCTTVERGVVFSLVIFLLLILLFLSSYPVALNRNILVHCLVYTVYFLGISLIELIHNVVGRELIRQLNNVVLVMTIGCYLGWMFLLTRAGETRAAMLRHNWTPEGEQRLIDQLNNINATLLRVSRREHRL